MQGAGTGGRSRGVVDFKSSPQVDFLRIIGPLVPPASKDEESLAETYVKRALHIHKRALHIHKRALYIHKRRHVYLLHRVGARPVIPLKRMFSTKCVRKKKSDVHRKEPCVHTQELYGEMLCRGKNVFDCASRTLYSYACERDTCTHALSFVLSVSCTHAHAHSQKHTHVSCPAIRDSLHV